MAVIAIEVVLRVIGIAHPQVHRLDPVLGWSPRPLVTSSSARANGAPIEINRAGFRDREHAIAKPDGVFRIVVLGDSFVAGEEVDFDELFWRVTNREIETCRPRGKRSEILGFGVNGYGTAQELLVLRNHALRYQPDLVLLAFFTGNDVINNSAALDRHPERPYFQLRNNELVLDDANLTTRAFRSELWWSDLGQSIYNCLRSPQVLRQLYLTDKARRKYLNLSVPEQLAADLDSGIYQPPETEEWISAWQISEALISRINRDATAAGADFWLVSMLARSIRDLQNIVYDLDKKGVTLSATEQPINTKTSAGKCFLDMLGVFSEFETNLRKERQMEGIEKAKERGVYKGRKPSVDVERVKALRDSGIGASAIAKEMGIGRASVYRALQG